MNIDEYETQAQNFLNETRTTFTAKYLYTGHYFPDDKETRPIYEITLRTPKGSHTFKFGDCVANKEKPKRISPYIVLACLGVYEAGTFNEFCDEYGYSTDSFKAFKTYQSVCEEAEGLRRVYTPEQLEKLREIN